MRQRKSADYIYVMASCIAGVWQAWCFTYGKNNLLVLVIIGMSLPFALVSYIHASLLNATGDIAQPPDWKGIIVLWAGMPLSIVVASLTGAAETGILYAAGFGIVNLPLYSLRLLIAEGTACLAWATCLLFWSRQRGIRPLRKRLVAISAALFAGVLTADGLSWLIIRIFHKDVYVLLESVVVTMLSALIVVFMSAEAIKMGDPGLASGF